MIRKLKRIESIFQFYKYHKFIWSIKSFNFSWRTCRKLLLKLKKIIQCWILLFYVVVLKLLLMLLMRIWSNLVKPVQLQFIHHISLLPIQLLFWILLFCPFWDLFYSFFYAVSVKLLAIASSVNFIEKIKYG